MKGIIKRLCTGFLALATMLTALPTTAVHASEKQYWTTGKEKAGVIEKVMNDGSIGSTFNESWFVVEGETAYCIDINTDFISGYKTRADASTRMSDDQISDVALSLEYVKQYAKTHNNLNDKQAYLLEQCVVWQRLSVHLGWECDNVRASYDEIPKSVQDEVYTGAKAFVKENKGRYECGGYIYSGQGQELGQFWAKLAVGNATLKKTSSNASITDGNKNYSLAGATYGVFSDKACNNQLATLTTDNSGNTETVEVKAGTVYIKELSAPTGFKVDKTVYSLKVEAGKTATLKVSDVPKATDISIELFKIDMETQKDTPQGDASLAGAEFTWRYYDGYYNKDNLPAQPTRTWVTKTIAEKDSDGTLHYVTKLSDAYKVSGDSFYTQDGKTVLPLGTLTVEETKSPTGYLLEGAYLQADGSSEPIKGLYVTQITEDGDLATLTGSNQYHVSDKVIRGGVKAQKRDLETGDVKPQGGATLKDTAFTITTLNDNAVLVEGKLYNKGEAVKTIYTGLDGIASTSADLLPYGRYELEEQTPPTGYLTDGAKPIQFEITENGKIVDLTDEAHSVYNQIKRGDLEGVKIGAGTYKRLADVPFRITSKTTGESHIIVTDDNGQFSTSADWASHKHDTNEGKDSEDGVWFGTSEPDDTKGALLYDTYIIEELRSDSNKGFELIPPFEIVVSRNNVTVDLGTLTDEYEQEISIHTTATSKDGEKSIVAGKEVTINDTVKLDGLKKGTKYQLKGWQMLKEDNTELLIDGERVENSYTFTADSEEMTVKMEYTFNASALGGKDLVTFEELYDLTDKDEPVKVAEHKDIDDDGQTVSIEKRIINIHTTATSTEGEKSLVAGNKVTIIDTVTLENLEIGTEYQLTGWQMLKENNTELLINGERVENSYTFTADDEDMKIEMEYTFNASTLAGKDLVTFEELYDMTNEDEPVKVAEHKDIEDEGQTVLITKRIITIHTTATDKDGNKELTADGEITLIDKVELDGLEVGATYQLVGWQMLKEDKAELLIDGKRVENSYTFTADSEHMEIEIAFTFDADGLDGKQLVTFEELYDLTDKDEPVKVAEHKDIEDEGQTVTFKEHPEVPEEPTEPQEPETPATPHKPTDSPKTGDSTNIALFAGLLALSGAGIAGAYFFKRRNAKKS
ncbi:VaFE repeat-containing surface-anchored protein [Clostridioides difficile]|uniref:VaFE repeat-containing surface-anchored protein n=1 Tax=Clostridioides difficile TaxID=1496 RepID=UPI002FCD874E